MVKVELVYIAENQTTWHLQMDLKQGTTVGEALVMSGIYNQYPETKELPVGIYAKQVPLHTILKAGDRVEIYRLLARDPKEKRRQLARLRK